jgi:hypothetical protein
MLRILLGIVTGFVLGWVATAAAALTYGEFAGVSQREGAFAMGAIFVMGPAGGVLGAVAGAVLGVRRDRRARQRDAAPPEKT